MPNDLLDPPPFCIQTPDERWHATPATLDEVAGRLRYAAGVIGRTACSDRPVRITATATQRQPTCDDCYKLIVVGEVMKR